MSTSQQSLTAVELDGVPSPCRTAVETGSVDGRHARRDRNRDRVIDAVIELLTAGVLRPTVGLVAKRSGVSLRSVYRYFDDVDDLMVAAIDERLLAEAATIARFDVQGSRAERIDAFVEHRLDLYESFGDIHRASQIWASDDPAHTRARTTFRTALTAQVHASFAEEFDALDAESADRVATLIDVVSHIGSLEHLRADPSADRASVAEFLRNLIDHHVA